MLPFSLLELRKIKPDVIYVNDAVHGFGTTFFFKKIPIVYVAHGIGYLRSEKGSMESLFVYLPGI